MKNNRESFCLISVSFFCGYLFLGCFSPWAAAEEALAVVETEIGGDQSVLIEPVDNDADLRDEPDNGIAEQTLKEINLSLRRAVEENRKLLDEKSALENEIKRVRGEMELLNTRLRTLSVQRDNSVLQIEEAKSLRQESIDKMEKLMKEFAQKESEYAGQIRALEKEAAGKKEMEAVMPWLSQTPEKFFGPSDTPDEKLTLENSKLKVDSVKLIKETRDGLHGLEFSLEKVSGKVEALKQENKRLRIESAKQHYNMGNVFFEQRRYKEAVSEYKRVTELIPYDPAAHYNLAFVSGEFLKDYATALKHYEQYLILNPSADDAARVKTKIVEAKLQLGTSIGPPLDSKLSDRAAEVGRF